MNFYDKLINVRGLDISLQIEKSLEYAREYYENLTYDRTCFIYTSLVYDKLKSLGVSSRFVNTNDLGLDYLHYFILVPYGKDKYYLVDPTYSQFRFDENVIVDDLLEKGYVSLDDDIWNKYMSSIFKSCDITVDETFNHIKK